MEMKFEWALGSAKGNGGVRLNQKEFSLSARSARHPFIAGGKFEDVGPRRVDLPFGGVYWRSKVS